MSEKEQVIQAIRATLISVKGALTFKQCNRDYKELEGDWIPFKKLGFNSLDQLFQQEPGFKIFQRNGENFVDVIASPETQHIVDMVSRQKSSKKSHSRFNPSSNYNRKYRVPVSHSFDYGSQYSNQYYRVKPKTSFANNNNNNDFDKFPSKAYKPEAAKMQPKSLPLVSKQEPRNTVYNETQKTLKKSNKSIANTIISQDSTNKYSSHSTANKTTKFGISQRLDSQKEKINTIDLIPLQMPAVHNENLKEKHDSSAPAISPPPQSCTSVEKLEWTCRKLGLPEPVYKLQDMKLKRGPVSFDCSIKVGTQYSVSSYPNSQPSKDMAKNFAAQKLLDEIENSKIVGIPTSTTNKAIEGLSELVSEHNAGLWANIVPHLYREKYKENLPDNWQELIDTCTSIKKDKVVNGLLVLLPEKEPVSLKSLQFENTEGDLPPLRFPEDRHWNVHITLANSSLEIWIQLLGPDYSILAEQLLTSMTTYYMNHGTYAEQSSITINSWYAVKIEDESWLRAKVLEINKNMATVFLGDYGDDEIVPISDIKILEPRFRLLPAQAILCRLEGAEELGACAAGAKAVQQRLAVGTPLVAEPGLRCDPADPAVPLVLYDTQTDRDINLNKEIIDDFCLSGTFNITQKPCEVEVACVSDEGGVWVSRAGGAELVRDALALLTDGPYRRDLPPAPITLRAHADALYIVRTLAGDWVRCTVISGLDGEGTVRTQLVDSGLVLRAPLASLVPLKDFSPALNAYPRQARAVRLGGAEHAAGAMAVRLREMLIGARVLCRALPSPRSPTSPSSPAPHPQVELFVRTPPQNILVSVNNSIISEYEFTKQNLTLDKSEERASRNPIEALKRKKERIFGGGGTAAAVGEAPAAVGARAPSSPLPPAQLPEPGEFIDVNIAMSANPWNFIVQPNKTRHLLGTMMNSLQIECPKMTELDAPANPACGELYTVYYDDAWYRVLVAGKVSAEMVTLYFCDYGDMAVVDRSALRPAPRSVDLARKLPAQAIKARLYNIMPSHQDWSVEDCLWFQNLCVGQQYVGICKEVSRDPLNPAEPLLTLDLINTSTDDDIYLNKQMHEEGRGRLVHS